MKNIASLVFSFVFSFALFSVLIFSLYLSFSFFVTQETSATSHENLMKGWAWSHNIGWISLTCENDNCSTSNYQVKVDPFTGEMSGYAWSSNIGWIKFDPAGPYPSSPSHFAKILTVDTPSGARKQVQGWVRACSVFANPSGCSGALNINRGDWDGWIKMSGSTTNCPAMQVPSPSEYETCVSADGTSLEGWAWGSDVIGWIQFDPAFNDIFVPGSSTKIKEIRPR